MSRNQLFGLGIALSLAATSGTAMARQRTPQAFAGGFIALGAEGEAPAGFLAMCRQMPEFCPSAPVQTAPPQAALMPIGMALSIPLLIRPATETVAPALDLAQLRKVNNLVNRGVRQITDLRAFGVDDLWRPSGIGRGAVGDCEDLALEKQRQLAALGYPPSATLLAVVYRRNVGLHVVLVVRSAGGDVVLDNRSGKVLPWRKARYSWLRVQSPADPTRWNQIGAPPAAETA